MPSPNEVLNRVREPAKRIVPLRLRAPLNRAYFAALSLYYRGGQYFCPCCGNAVKAFLPYASYGGPAAPSAQCPACGCLARHRLAWQFLKTEMDIERASLRLLHFAPEPALQQRLRALPGLDYLSADIASPLAMVRMDITAIPEADASFDAIICSHVLAHVPDDGKAMREMYRVLRPSGWALIQTAVDDARPTFEDASARTAEERLAVYGQADLWRVYGCDFVERLEAVGFAVRTVRRGDVGDSHSPEQMGLDEAPLYLCVRPA